MPNADSIFVFNEKYEVKEFKKETCDSDDNREGKLKVHSYSVKLYQVRLYLQVILKSLQWRHNGGNGVSNHQPHEC